MRAWGEEMAKSRHHLTDARDKLTAIERSALLGDALLTVLWDLSSSVAALHRAIEAEAGNELEDVERYQGSLDLVDELS
jgi:hypothetical protein